MLIFIKKTWFHLLIIFLTAFILRLLLYHTVYWRTNDTVEYINLARNLASGHGFVQNFKFLYFDNTQVITSSFHGRTSLLSIFLAIILLIHGNGYGMQVFNFLIGSIDACLVYILCRHFVRAKWSFVAGFLAAINPNLLINSRLILAEPLFSLFILLALIFIMSLKDKFTKYILIGVICALAFLTRFEGVLLLLLITIVYINQPKRIIKTFLLVGAFLVITLPFFYENYKVNGNPFYSYLSHYYTMKDSYKEVLNGNGYGRIFPLPFTFVKNNFSFIVRKDTSAIFTNINLLMQFDFISPFLFFLLLVFLHPSWKKFRLFYLYAFLIFLFYTSAWSTLQELSRSFTVIFLLLLVPLSYALEKLSKTWVIWLFLALIFIPYGILDIHRIIWARTVDMNLDAWSRSDKKPLYSWIIKNIKEQEIISSTSPEMIYFYTNRAGIKTPNNLDNNNFKKYVNYYKVKYFLIEDPNRYMSYLRLVKTFNGENIYKIY